MLIYFKLFSGKTFLKSLNLTDVIGVLANNPINSFHKNAAKYEKLTSTHLWKKEFGARQHFERQISLEYLTSSKGLHLKV